MSISVSMIAFDWFYI